MDSTNADALYVRGLCLYYEDCIEKAVQFFVQALRMAPDHEKACLACRVSRDAGNGAEDYLEHCLPLLFIVPWLDIGPIKLGLSVLKELQTFRFNISTSGLTCILNTVPLMLFLPSFLLCCNSLIDFLNLFTRISSQEVRAHSFFVLNLYVYFTVTFSPQTSGNPCSCGWCPELALAVPWRFSWWKARCLQLLSAAVARLGLLYPVMVSEAKLYQFLRTLTLQNMVLGTPEPLT